MNRWIEARELAELARGLDLPSGQQSLVEALEEHPDQLLVIGPAECPPVDRATYRVRAERARSGSGPAVRGMDAFMAQVESDDVPSRLVTVEGSSTRYSVLLDEDVSTILAAVAIDPPAATRR